MIHSTTHTSLDTTHTALETKYGELQVTHSNVCKERDSLRLAQTDTRGKYDRVKRERDNFKSKLESTTTTLTKETSAKNAALAALQAANSSLEDTARKLEQAEAQMGEKDVKIAKHTKDDSASRDYVTYLTERVFKLQSELADANAARASLERKNLSLARYCKRTSSAHDGHGIGARAPTRRASKRELADVTAAATTDLHDLSMVNFVEVGEMNDMAETATHQATHLATALSDTQAHVFALEHDTQALEASFGKLQLEAKATSDALEAATTLHTQRCLLYESDLGTAKCRADDAEEKVDVLESQLEQECAHYAEEDRDEALDEVVHVKGLREKDKQRVQDHLVRARKAEGDLAPERD